MKYDLIIVACSSTPRLIQTTKNCINSAREDNADLNIIVVETYDVIYEYENCTIIHYTEKFNYNHALNLGIEQAEGDVFILANNDIVFHQGWSQIGELMIVNSFDSASALSSDVRQRGFVRGDYIYPGYEIGLQLAGWCIFVTRKCIETIGKLDESFEFWYADNMYAEQLKKHNLKHGLFCNVFVDHLISVTIKSMSNQVQQRYCFNADRKYNAMKKQR